MSSASLRPLFEPRSIAVVGASQTPGKAGHEMFKALGSFPGKRHAVNPRVRRVLGNPAYERVADIDTNVDLAVIALPAAQCLEAVEDCAAAGVGSVMIVSGGFAESGTDGETLQAEIVAVCRQSGMRLLGPNTSGFANPRARLVANFAPGMQDLVAGPVGIVSQSGAVTLALSALAAEQHLGVGLAVGTGNGRDVAPADVVGYLRQREDIRVITLYLEGIRDGRALCETIASVAPEKPVLVYTVGQADIGAFAASHTGNLMGSYALKTSALRQAGAVVVDSLEALIDTAQLLCARRLRPQASPGIGLVTGQAGPGMIISDYLKTHGVAMPALQAQTVETLQTLLPPMTYQLNPVDTGRPGDTFGAVLATVCADPGVDAAVAFALHEPAAIDPVSALHVTVEESGHTPLVFGTAGATDATAPAIRSLNRAGIPALTSADRTARAVRYLVEDARHTYRLLQAAPGRRFPPARNVVDVPEDADAPKDEWAAKRRLADIGITGPAGRECATHEDALEAFAELPKPVVVKILSADIGHKTEVGGVFLGIESKAAMRAALDAIDAIETGGGRDEHRYLVETQAPPGLELILGARRDDSFGPTLLVGTGGTLAEALGDVALRMAPVSPCEAAAMLDELRASVLLDGWRGSPALDKTAVIDALVALGEFLVNEPSIGEIDINPVRVYPDGLLALDALFIASPSIAAP